MVTKKLSNSQAAGTARTPKTMQCCLKDVKSKVPQNKELVCMKFLFIFE